MTANPSGAPSSSVGQTQGLPSLSVTLCTESLNHTSGAPSSQSGLSSSLLPPQKKRKKKKKKVRACMCSVYNACVCEGETEEARLGSSAEPPFLWHLWQMARPFEEQSTAIDVKLPALKTEGPAQPHLFTVSPRAAWAARPVTNAALVPRFIHSVGQCQPAKSITSHSSAAGESVISTLSPPGSGRTSASVYFMMTTSMFFWVYLSNVIDFTHTFIYFVY